MNCSVISSFFIFQEVLLFPFSKIIGIYLQNIARAVFLFHLQIGTIYHRKNFLITKTSNSQIAQDLGSTEYMVERSNQTAFFFTVNATFYIVVMISLVRQFWPYFCYGGFQFIKLITVFGRIDDFTLRKELIVNYIFLIPSNG